MMMCVLRYTFLFASLFLRILSSLNVQAEGPSGFELGNPNPPPQPFFVVHVSEKFRVSFQVAKPARGTSRYMLFLDVGAQGWCNAFVSGIHTHFHSTLFENIRDIAQCLGIFGRLQLIVEKTISGTGSDRGSTVVIIAPSVEPAWPTLCTQLFDHNSSSNRNASCASEQRLHHFKRY